MHPNIQSNGVIQLNRTLFKGHIHTDRKVEYMTSNETAGFIEKTLPSLGKQIIIIIVINMLVIEDLVN